MRFFGFLQVATAADFFQWRIPEFLYRYGNSTCTFIGQKMHISGRAEISRFEFTSAGCPDGTLWLPEDLDAHGLGRTILEFPGPISSCGLSEEAISRLHDFLSRLCLGPDIAGGLLLRDALNETAMPILAGRTVGDLLAFAVSVSSGRNETASETNDETPPFTIELAQGLHHTRGGDDGPDLEISCIFRQGSDSALLVFDLKNRENISFVESFDFRDSETLSVSLGPFSLLTPLRFTFSGWRNVCEELGHHIKLDLPSMKESLLDADIRLSPRKSASGECRCVLHNAFGMELVSILQGGGNRARYDMTSLACESFAYYAVAGPCPLDNCAYVVTDDFSFSSACGSRRRPASPFNASFPSLAEILAQELV